MAAVVLWNKSFYMKEWMAQADPLKESSTFDRMNGRLQLLSSKKITQYFEEWTTSISVLEKYITSRKI